MPWYFFMDVIFCAMAIGTIIWAWPKLGWVWRLSATATAIVVMPLQVLNEYLSLYVVFAWTFSLKHNKMIGWDIFGTPVEEYMFWFAFAWFTPFLYSGFVAYFASKDRANGKKVEVDPND